MRKTVIVSILVGLLAGCSASKELNEESGRRLIAEATAKKPFMASLSGVEGLMVRTQIDYSLVSASGNDVKAAMKRLLDKGLIVARVETFAFPKISGTFSGLPSPVCAGRVSVPPAISLNSAPSSNALTGEFVHTGCDGSVQKESLGGTVNADGVLDLSVGGLPFQTKGRYEEHNGSADMKFSVFAGYPPTAEDANFHGPATGQKVEAKWYNYSFSSDFQNKIIRGGSGLVFSAGEIQVGEVSELRLVAETAAACRFSWDARLNNIGTAVLGVDKQSGIGSASFSKKPDGSWILLEWRLN